MEHSAVDRQAGEAIKTLLQVLAIAGGGIILSMILHKASTDISALAWQHSGDGFCKALAKYLLGNLAGG